MLGVEVSVIIGKIKRGFDRVKQVHQRYHSPYIYMCVCVILK